MRKLTIEAIKSRIKSFDKETYNDISGMFNRDELIFEIKQSYRYNFQQRPKRDNFDKMTDNQWKKIRSQRSKYKLLISKL